MHRPKPGLANRTWSQGGCGTAADVFQQSGDPAGGAAALGPVGEANRGGGETTEAIKRAGVVGGGVCGLEDHDWAGFKEGKVSGIPRAAKPGLRSRTPATGSGPRAG